jgi:cobalamin-dependent methionine synthase I
MILFESDALSFLVSCDPKRNDDGVVNPEMLSIYDDSERFIGTCEEDVILDRRGRYRTLLDFAEN